MSWRKTVNRVAAVAVLSAMPALVGCHYLFSCEGKTSCGTDSSTSSTNVIFVGNSSSGSTYINAYTNTTGTIAAVTGSPFLLSYVPSAMVVDESNSYLYVASQGGIIYRYAVSSAGVPSSGTSQVTPGYAEASMDVSADGNWLFAIDDSTSSAPVLHVYAIGTSGALTETTQGTLYTPTGYSIVPKMVRVSPKNDYVAVANGSGGTQIFPFTTSSGTLSTASYVNTSSAADGDSAIAWDGSDRLYMTRTTSTSSGTSYSVLVYNASTGKMITTSTPSSYTTGTAPTSITFAEDYAYLYVGNRSDSTISAFSQSSGALTAIGTTNVAGPTTVSALTTDKSGDYVVAAGYNSSSGLQIFTIGSTGALTVNTTAAATGTTTSVPTVLAATH